MRLQSLFTLSLILTALVGCGGSTSSSARDAAALDMTAPSDLGASTGDDAFMRVSESDVAAILDSINSGEILEAQAALGRGLVTPVATDFANMMVDMHTAAKMRQDALFAQLGITPTPNSESMMLATEAARVVSVLQKLSGIGLDEAYLDSQVAGHQKALDDITLLLLPSTSTPLLRQELLATQATVTMHLTMAKGAQDTLVGLDY